MMVAHVATSVAAVSVRGKSGVTERGLQERAQRGEWTVYKLQVDCLPQAQHPATHDW